MKPEYLKNEKGELSSTRFISFVFLNHNKTYTIQYKILPFKNALLTVYQSKKKPIIRNVSILSLGIPIAYLVFATIFIIAIVSYFLGRGLYALAKIIKAIGLLFMLSPRAAKDEFISILESRHK